MAEKDKLSQEVIGQLKRLANDVSNQIEEKLIHILYEEPYKESSEKNKTLSEQIQLLEQKIIKLKKALDDERANKVIHAAKLIPNGSESSKNLAELQQEVEQLENKNQQLSDSLIAKQASIKSYLAEISSLKDQVTTTQQEQASILSRFNANREKQEKDNNKVRETIKYLRDENNEMINQINEQKEEAIEKVNALENKLTEYRLKFEYAQKQLTQNS